MSEVSAKTQGCPQNWLKDNVEV